MYIDVARRKRYQQFWILQIRWVFSRCSQVFITHIRTLMGWLIRSARYINDIGARYEDFILFLWRIRWSKCFRWSHVITWPIILFCTITYGLLIIGIPFAHLMSIVWFNQNIIISNHINISLWLTLAYLPLLIVGGLLWIYMNRTVGADIYRTSMLFYTKATLLIFGSMVFLIWYTLVYHIYTHSWLLWLLDISTVYSSVSLICFMLLVLNILCMLNVVIVEFTGWVRIVIAAFLVFGYTIFFSFILVCFWWSLSIVGFLIGYNCFFFDFPIYLIVPTAYHIYRLAGYFRSPEDKDFRMHSLLNRRLLVIFTGVSLGFWLSIQIVYWSAIQPLITLIWLFLLIAAAARLINVFFMGKNILPVKYFPAQTKEHGNSFILAWFLASICFGIVLFVYILYKYNSALLLGLMVF